MHRISSYLLTFTCFVLLLAFTNCEKGEDEETISHSDLTLANYEYITGTEISNQTAKLTITSGIIVNHPFSAGTVIYGVSSDGNYFKMKILNDIIINNNPGNPLSLSYILYDKSSPAAVLQSSASSTVVSSFTFDFETNTADDSAADIYFHSVDETEFDLDIYTAGVKCLAFVP